MSSKYIEFVEPTEGEVVVRLVGKTNLELTLAALAVVSEFQDGREDILSLVYGLAGAANVFTQLEAIVEYLCGEEVERHVGQFDVENTLQPVDRLAYWDGEEE